MGLQRIILWLGPLLYVLGALYFVTVSTPAQRRAVLLTWLCPGLGHWKAGHARRGAFFAVALLGLFLGGLCLSDFRCISPLDRHPIWALLQIPCLLPTALATVLTSHLTIDSDNAYYQIGCLYVGLGCMLNLIVMCDVYDLLGPDAPAEPKAEAS